MIVLSQLIGCSSLGLDEAIPDQRLVYKKQREAGLNLEIPPDLTGSNFDDALDIPSGGGAATFSEYTGSRAQRQQIASNGDVLPAVSNIELKRTGNERWLAVQAPPQQVWPKVIAFWREQGILLVEQDPAVGVMRTDWLDNRAEIRQDFLTRMAGKLIEGVYATSTRDQYSLRIEEGTSAGTTDIHLTHRGMEEKLVTNAIGDGSRTIWEPSGTDSAKEAEMLRRLMVFMGAAKASVAVSADPSSAPAQGPRSRLLTEGGAQVLLIPEEFRRAWRLTGSALDRAGFAVEDRDQSSGLFYVRYAGKDNAERSDGKKPGLGSRLAFWRKNEIDPVKQYRIQVVGKDTESRVSVLDATGKPDQSESGRRILTLMQEQMR
ncbi:outer membrane protein assembly factor BamC [uncultured Thiocystis sp.]|uniref:outer membrane protein assembly factor BamC n=1 Tax=uncultured Thiocystis sp. TaxID=1202134 RepID=UPI0025E13C89|nr:outer membrane protein assembly factor BamC [uncultured Thiocystis sp.]